MQAITTIGLDIEKSVFQVHGIDAGGQVVIPAKIAKATAAAIVRTLDAPPPVPSRSSWPHTSR